MIIGKCHKGTFSYVLYYYSKDINNLTSMGKHLSRVLLWKHSLPILCKLFDIKNG